MPAWEDRLTEEQIWQVIIYLYEATGHPPRVMESHAARPAGSGPRVGTPGRRAPPSSDRGRRPPSPATSRSGSRSTRSAAPAATAPTARATARPPSSSCRGPATSRRASTRSGPRPDRSDRPGPLPDHDGRDARDLDARLGGAPREGPLGGRRVRQDASPRPSRAPSSSPSRSRRRSPPPRRRSSAARRCSRRSSATSATARPAAAIRRRARSSRTTGVTRSARPTSTSRGPSGVARSGRTSPCGSPPGWWARPCRPSSTRSRRSPTKDTRADASLWHLANYVRSLGPERLNWAPLLSIPPVTGDVPADPNAEFWEKRPGAAFPLVGQVIVDPRNFNPTDRHGHRAGGVHRPGGGLPSDLGRPHGVRSDEGGAEAGHGRPPVPDRGRRRETVRTS